MTIADSVFGRMFSTCLVVSYTASVLRVHSTVPCPAVPYTASEPHARSTVQRVCTAHALGACSVQRVSTACAWHNTRRHAWHNTKRRY
eukprot:3849978-Rhodomonas_salina.2